MQVRNASAVPSSRRFARFAEFYPYYLGEHSDPTCRRLHVFGTSLAIALAIAAVVLGEWWLFAAVPVAGYGFAWVGHFFFERNRPATFRHPLYSLAGDFAMFRDVIARRIRL
jgi:hypothetical protein